MTGAGAIDREAEFDAEVIIVGAGFAGIGAGIQLKEAGIEDFVILEKANEVGGTWRDNTYPGLAVDVPSYSYSYSFELNPNWSRLYAPGAELQQYAKDCTDKYDLRNRIRFGTSVLCARYDEALCIWEVELADGGRLKGRFLISASGLLILPKMPEIEGIETLSGTVLHSARWDHEVDLKEKRVAVIGTGATAVQLIPAIVDKAASLDVYQRTPIWLMPKPDQEFSERTQRLFRSFPFSQKFLRLATSLLSDVMLGFGFLRHRRFPWIFEAVEKRLVEYIEEQVDDPETQKALTPNYSFFCKRPSFSNEYFAVFNRKNVDLVTSPIARVDETSIATEDGRARPVDVLICATGYDVFNRSCPPTFEVEGRDGKNLKDFWERERFQAFMGASVPDFPNFFLVLGPYSAPGISYFDMINTQVHHLVRCIKAARRNGARSVEVKREAHEKDLRHVLARKDDTVFGSGSCDGSNSYYIDKHGDVPGLRPMSFTFAWLKSRTFSLKAYRFLP